MKNTQQKEINNTIKKVFNGNNLSRRETYNAFRMILNREFEKANDVVFGAFFAALQTKTPTNDEILGLLDVVLKYDRVGITYNKTSDLCGIVGSGKDDLKTFNISTAAAIVASAAGVKVVKNGSRAESSIAGTTDVLEALGVNVTATPKQIINSLKKNGITFCDAAPYFPRMGKEYIGKFIFPHPLSYILSIASGLEFKSMVFGSALPDTEKIGQLLIRLGMRRFIVAAGSDSGGKSIDELSIIGPTKITEFKSGIACTYTIQPEDLGLKRAKYKDIKQRDSITENAQLILDILNTQNINRGAYDAVVLNAGALIYVAGISDTIILGVKLAQQAIESGEALKKLNKLVETTNE